MSMPTIIIDRQRWSPGKHAGGDVTGLYQLWVTAVGSTPATCCLGELGLNLGASPQALLNAPMPSMTLHACDWPKALFVDDTRLQPRNAAYRTEGFFAELNDYEDIDDATREEWIAKAFEVFLGYRVEYVNAYRDGPRGVGGALCT